MKRTLAYSLLWLVLFAFIIILPAFAEESKAEPLILPSSPLYFFKEWGRGLQRLLTSDSVKRAALELEVLNTKAVELIAVSQKLPERKEAIIQALENFKTSQKQLEERLKALEETSKNPNVDALLGKVVDRTLQHEQLISKLIETFSTKVERKAIPLSGKEPVQGLTSEDKEKILKALKQVKDTVKEMLIAASQKDEAIKFTKKFEKALEEMRGNIEKRVRSSGILRRLKGKVAPAFKKFFGEVKQRLLESFKSDVKKIKLEPVTPAPVQLPIPESIKPCVISGCSAELCSLESMTSICVFKPEFVCYKTAQCGLQPNGQCGWTETPELKDCLEKARDIGLKIE